MLKTLKKNKLIRKIYFDVKKKYISILSRISPKIASIVFYNRYHKKKINLKNPQLFNEKLVYLKLKNIKNPLIIKCTDKYLVREYVEEKGYHDILNDLIEVYDKVEEIEWKKLPNKFVLKCNHGCGYNIICTDKNKLNIKECKNKLRKWMNTKYGYETVELHYTYIKPKIICEKFLDIGTNKLPTDYKIYCFNGRPKLILVMNDREKNIKKEFYDLQWNLVHLRDNDQVPKKLTEKPKNLNEMLACAAKLSEPFEFVRVDFYNIKDKIIFGELTFTPAGCNAQYTATADKYLGELLDINK